MLSVCLCVHACVGVCVCVVRVCGVCVCVCVLLDSIVVFDNIIIILVHY